MKTLTVLCLLSLLLALTYAQCGGTQCKGGCCPYAQATCCPSGNSCCPHGYSCDEAHQQCNSQPQGGNVPMIFVTKH
ncbi:hypothetical protein L596_010327 [Steinernema carpocapsae]|uniref:Granulins domain-containing protein n=1 Tax=Steinernema carpocapsae TaxID=34508 RepID=A0A4U5PI18_STECR|nr:hypothetical protein L596_010327 [Steinernema carpocapsae]